MTLLFFTRITAFLRVFWPFYGRFGKGLKTCYNRKYKKIKSAFAEATADTVKKIWKKFPIFWTKKSII
jgi:hypothetical protein